MARDPLPVLLRARRMAQDDARRALADGVKAEADASDQLAATDREVAEEARCVTALAPDSAARIAYGAWLERARRARRDAQATLAVAREQSGVLRERMREARAASRVAEALLAKQAVARKAAADRQEQVRLDEAGQWGRRGLGPPGAA